MDGAAVRQRLLDSLMERIEGDTYPSPTMMDHVEGALRTREQVLAYAETLLEKIDASRYPSSSMINRLYAVLDRVE